MKIKNTVGEAITQQLNEAARFGNAQMQQIKKLGRQFFVGVEYEFNYQNTAPPTVEDVRDNPEFDYIIDDFENAEEEYFMDEYCSDSDINDIIELLTRLKEAYNSFQEVFSATDASIPELPPAGQLEFSQDVLPFDVDEDGLVDLSDSTEELFASFGELSEELSRFQNVNLSRQERELRSGIVDAWFGDLLVPFRSEDDPGVMDVFSHYYRLGKELGWISATGVEDADDLSKVRDIFSKMRARLPELEKYSVARDEADEYNMRDAATAYVRDTAMFKAAVDDRIQSSIDHDDDYALGNPVDTAESFWGDDSRIYAIEHEHDRMVEIISEPLPLAEQFEFMGEMFDHIKEHGYTSSNSGMHVNISHRLMAKNPKGFNMLKMVVLLDPDFMQMRTSKMRNAAMKKSRLFKWEIRNSMVSALMNLVDKERLKALASHYATGRSFDDLEDMLENMVITADKFRGINFTSYVSPSMNSRPDQRRIEFRFFGGEGYEDRFDDIQHDIYFICYSILAAYDKDYLRKEYVNGLLRLLDRRTADISNNPNAGFMDLVAAVRSQIRGKMKHDNIWDAVKAGDV